MCSLIDYKIKRRVFTFPKLQTLCFLYNIHIRVEISLSHTEHGWAHGSNTVYSVINGLSGTSVELQPCLGTI